MCFFLSLGWVRPEHFVNITSNVVPSEAMGKQAVSSPDMIPHLYHHRLNPCLADLLWCRVVYHILSISKRRKAPQSDSGIASMEGVTSS